MSHLLYLHAFDWSRFEAVFGRGKKADIDLLTRDAGAKARAIVEKAVNQGIDMNGLSKEAASVLASAVAQAFSTTKYKIRRTPISPMGTSATLLEAFAHRFTKVKAKALFEHLRRGADNNPGLILFSPDDVRQASALLLKVAAIEDRDVDPELDAEFASELVEPFANVAKKTGRGISGAWS